MSLFEAVRASGQPIRARSSSLKGLVCLDTLAIRAKKAETKRAL